MMNRRHMRSALVVALLGLSTTVQAQDTPAAFADAQAFIERAMAESDIPSVAVAVAHNGRLVYSRGFGWANIERRIAATPRTMYSLASISKPMTATAFMQFVEDGRIELDQPANAYLGAGRIHSRVWDASKATVRRVLSHSAGLPLHYEFFYEGEDHPRRSTDEGIARYGFLIAEPGTTYQYSNLGFGIVERMMEHVARREYGDLMEATVFEPLGMTRTTVSTGAGLDDSVAVRYGPDDEAIPYYDFDHRGGSAVYSSALDLVRFGLYHLGRLDDATPILADSTLRLMHRPATPGDPNNGYGLGWSIMDDDGGYQRISHTGGMPGVSTGLYLYPETGVVVAVLTNRSNGMVGRIAQELAGSVMPDYAEAIRVRRASAEAARSATDNGTSDFTPADALVGAWEGTIYTPDDSIPLHLLVKPDGDIHVRLGDDLRTLLNDPSSPEDNRLVGRFSGTIPETDAQRHAHTVLLDVRLDGGVLRGQATAQTTGWPYYFALSSFVELVRDAR